MKNSKLQVNETANIVAFRYGSMYTFPIKENKDSDLIVTMLGNHKELVHDFLLNILSLGDMNVYAIVNGKEDYVPLILNRKPQPFFFEVALADKRLLAFALAYKEHFYHKMINGGGGGGE